MYRLLYTAEAKKQIQRLGAQIRLRLRAALESIAIDPTAGKRLTAELSDFYSYRVGDYRIIYKIVHQQLVVIVITVGHRREVYEKMSRNLR